MVSLGLSYLVVVTFFWSEVLGCLSLLFWVFLNRKFFVFLMTESNILFGLISIVVTFFDHMIMGLGVTIGFIKTIFSRRRTLPKEKP